MPKVEVMGRRVRPPKKTALFTLTSIRSKKMIARRCRKKALTGWFDSGMRQHLSEWQREVQGFCRMRQRTTDWQQHARNDRVGIGVKLTHGVVERQVLIRWPERDQRK